MTGASNWFGDLQLAYKYIVVFCGLLVLVFVAGLIKVFFDRRKLKKIIKKEELEAGPKEDQVELNQREKDEGDLFGIRAIEAGFYAGVAQSRPTSRAGSVHGTPAMSSSTLVAGGANSPLMKGSSANNSVLSLNLSTNERRKSPPQRLSPSEAELTGRHGAVDMSLQVPPSPGHPRGSHSLSGSDSTDDYVTPRGNPSRSQDFHPQHYSPAPTIPMPDALQVTYHDVQNTAKSQAASYNSSLSSSPPPPSNPPTSRLPTIPTATLRNDSRSPSPEYSYPPRAQATTEPAPLAPLPTLEPQALAPAHKRDASDASSLYSQKRVSTFDAYQTYQKQNGRSVSAASNDTYNMAFSSTDESRGTSVVMSMEHDPSSHLGVPGTQDSRMSLGVPSNQESRLSEFYEAYYRNSQVGAVQNVEAKRIVGRHSTIVEVDTPLASPMHAKSMQHPLPGAAF